MSAYNRVINLISAARLNNITILHVNDVHLDRIPNELFLENEAVGFTHIDLSNNRIQELPLDIGRLQDLEELNLEGNHLSSLPAELAYCSSLKYINLTSNPRLPQDLKQVYRNSANAPIGVKMTRGGKEFGPLRKYLMSKLTQSIPPETYIGQGRHSHSNTIVPAGHHRHSHAANLFDDEWGAYDVNKDSITGGKAVRKTNYSGYSVDVKYQPHSEWGQEEHVQRHWKRVAPDRSKPQVNVHMQEGPDPSQRFGKRVNPIKKKPNDLVMGKEWGVLDADHQVRDKRRHQFDYTAKDGLGKFGVVEQAPRDRRKRQPGSHEGMAHGHVYNAEWGQGGVEQRRNMRVVPEKVDNIHFSDGAVSHQQDEGRMFRKKKEVDNAPANNFQIAPSSEPLELRRKRASPNERFNTTQAHEFLTKHGETQQLAHMEKYEKGHHAHYAAPRYKQAEQMQGGGNRGLARAGSTADLTNYEFLSAEQLPRLNDDALGSVITRLMSGDKREQFFALNDMRSMAKWNSSVLPPQLRTFAPVVNTLVNSLHMAVAKNAMITIHDLYQRIPRQMNEYVMVYMPSLLQRAALGNEIMSEVAQQALIVMSRNLPPVSMLPALYKFTVDPSDRIAGWACYCIRELLLRMDDGGAFLCKGVTNDNLTALLEQILRLMARGDASVVDLSTNTLSTLAQVISSHIKTLEVILKQIGRQDLIEFVRSSAMSY